MKFVFAPHRNGRQGAPTTMRMAVNLLTDKNQEMQISGANFIQNRCFSSADAKIRVSKTDLEPSVQRNLATSSRPSRHMKGVRQEYTGPLLISSANDLWRQR